MTPYTDTQIKQALAKMLPDSLFIDISKQLCWKANSKPNEPRDHLVKDTELLHICWLVEEGLPPAQKQQFAELLADGVNVVEWGYYPGEAYIDWSDVCEVAHATWQQRTIALAKVKGVEIL